MTRDSKTFDEIHDFTYTAIDDNAEPLVPMTREQYGEAYLSDSKKYWETTFGQPREITLKRVLAVIDASDAEDNRRIALFLGVGPLEELMGDWLLDQLADRLPFKGALRMALEDVRMEFEPPDLQKRFQSMMTATSGTGRGDR